MTIGIFIQAAIAPVFLICDMGGVAVVFGLCISHLGCSKHVCDRLGVRKDSTGAKQISVSILDKAKLQIETMIGEY
jgi:hypothetical protein